MSKYVIKPSPPLKWLHQVVLTNWGTVKKETSKRGNQDTYNPLNELRASADEMRENLQTTACSLMERKWKLLLGTIETACGRRHDQVEQSYLVWNQNFWPLDQHTTSIVKREGGMMMLWWCLSAAGPGRLGKVDGKIKFLEENCLQDNYALREDYVSSKIMTKVCKESYMKIV